MAAFCAALPSPPFEAARLDATRPMSAAGSTRVQPLLAGAAYQGAYEDTPVPPPALAEPPAPATDDNPLEQQPDDAGPAAGPDPLLAFIQRASRKPRVTATPKPKAPATTAQSRGTPAPTAPSPAAAARQPGAPQPPVARRWPPGEYPLYQKALADYGDPRQQLADLEAWQRQYPITEHEADRVFLYVEAYNRIAPPLPAKLVESAAPLLNRDPHSWFDDGDCGPVQTVAVLYLVTVSAARIPTASTSQLRTCHTAASRLLAYLPEFFDDRSRPSSVSEQSWAKARADMESAARQTLALRGALRTDNR